jgi:predicted nucleic acid-binding protein
VFSFGVATGHLACPVLRFHGPGEGATAVQIASRVGNAFSAMIRRGRLTAELAARAIDIYQSIPIRFVDVDLMASLMIASEHHLYAYDAYLIECSRARRAPLLTLDRALARVATKMMIDVMEIE